MSNCIYLVVGGNALTKQFRTMNFTFDNGHDGQTINNPVWTRIEKSLREINSDTSCFFILTADSGDYLQCAGGQSRITVEFRQVLKTEFKHFVLGKGEIINALKTVWTTINCRVGRIDIHEDEVLNLDETILTFKYFFKHTNIPPEFKKRNVTRDFKRLTSEK